jgi:MFS transporter, DHA3 family, multidrug efflux protein
MMQASSLVSPAFYAVALLGPYAKAAEQTIPQTVVPYEAGGVVRSQSIEEAASPLTAFPRR